MKTHWTFRSYTMSWWCWKHPFGIPGVRPMFLKPKLHKESKNGFKTINYRPYRMAIFSNYFFRYQKSSKKSDGFTSNASYDPKNPYTVTPKCLKMLNAYLGKAYGGQLFWNWIRIKQLAQVLKNFDSIYHLQWPN